MKRDVIWWDRDENKDERARVVHQRAMKLRTTQGEDRKSVLDDALIAYFGNDRHLTSGGYSGAMGLLSLLGGNMEPPGQNVIQSIVDQMVSYTIHNKVRAFALTESGDYQARADAQQITRAVEGVMSLERMHGGPLDIMTTKIAYLGDGGFVKVIPDYARRKVTYLPVLPHEWLVPNKEASKGNPRQGFHVYSVDRAMLLEDFGWSRDEDGVRHKTELYEVIKNTPAAPRAMTDNDLFSEDECADQVMVVDAYHLPSGWVDMDDDASFGLNDDGELDDDVDPQHDGRRMMTIGGATDDGVVCLLDEPYPYDEFPVCEFFPSLNPSGYWSRGVPETLAAGQLAVNRHNGRIEKIMHLHAVTRILAWRQSKINPNKLTNGVADVIFTNTPPSQAAMYLQPPGVPPELVNRVDRLIAWMKAQYGVNDMTLSGEKPPGLDHAPGMEHLQDELTLRHTEKGEGRNTFILKIARRTVEAIRLLALRYPDFEVVYFGDDKELVRIKWKDCALKRKQFVMRIWPSNLLPQTPGMKMRRVTEIANVFPELKPQLQGALVDQYPDVAALAGQAMYAEKNIRAMLDKIAREGLSEETMPHPYMNLGLAKALAAEMINRLEFDGQVDAMDGVISFHEQCMAMELKMQADAALAAAGKVPPPQAGAPQGAPPPQPPAPPPAAPQPGPVMNG